jgi:hypothetical protein
MEIAGAVVHGKLLRRMLNPRDISAEPRQDASPTKPIRRDLTVSVTDPK